MHIDTLKSCSGLRIWISLMILTASTLLLDTSLLNAQTTATYTGPDNGNWSDPANWDIGVVPINNGGNTYNVIVPQNLTIVFDVNGANEISGLNLQDTGQIRIENGRSLNVTGFTLIAGNVVTDGAGSAFTANSALTVFQPSPELHATGGATIQIAATSYLNERPYNRTFLSAIGTGSILDLSLVDTFDSDANSGFPNGTWTQTVEAGQGGFIDLSSLQTIDGPPGDDILRFWVHTGGNIDLQNLTTVLSSGGRRTQFDIDVPAYDFASLTDTDGVEFDIAVGSSVTADSLTSWRNGILDLLSGASFRASSLADVRGSTIRVESGSVLSTLPLTQIDNAEFHAHSGGVLNVAATSYSNDRNYRRTFMSALGAGSRLGLQSVQNFEFTGEAGFPTGIAVHTIEAGDEGVIDFSGVTNIDRGPGDDTLRFLMHTNGNIDFQNLQTINRSGGLAFGTPGAYGRTHFQIEIPVYDLPSLTNADGVRFSVDGFSTLNAANLVSFRNGHLDIEALETINTPLMTDIRGSYLRVSGATIFNAPAFSEIDDSELHANSGGTIEVAATSYTNNRGYSRAFLSSTGTGSELRLGSIRTVNLLGENGFPAGSVTHSIEATQNGYIDLSGVETIETGAGDDVLRIAAATSGRIDIGSAGSPINISGARQVRFESIDSNSVIRFGGNANLAPNTAVVAQLNGQIEVAGNLIITTQDADAFDLGEGILKMVGNGQQFLEVAGTDNGSPTGPIGSNFQAGLLQIGASTQVVLQNVHDNNGDRFDAEALYLQGLPSQTGLEIQSGSRLILNGHNLYFADDQGDFISAQDLIPDGSISVAYDGGEISLTSFRGDIINGNFDIDPQFIGFYVLGAGTARTVDSDFGSRTNQSVLELTAGSFVEVGQFISTPDLPFSITLEALAQDATGSLSLFLNEQLLQTWDISELGGMDPHQLSYRVDDPTLIGLINSPLALRWDGDTGHRLLVDNWQMIAVPEPGSSIAFLVCLSLLTQRRRRRLA